MKLKKIIKCIIKELFPKKKIAVPQIIYSNKLLDGKIALITGGSSGIGYAIAEEFIKNGCKVIICGTNETKLKKACSQLGNSSKFILLDVTKIDEIPSKMKEAFNIYNEDRIDILVNSAGVGAKSNFYNVTEQEFDQIINVNLKGTFFMTQMFSKILIEKQIKRHILNLSSSSALRPAWTPYEISKWGIRGFTLGAADILSSKNIIVNAIAPGPTATPMLNKKESDNLYINSNCINRMALPCEIAALAVYLCSDVGNMVVGDTFYITGGAGNIINRL